MHCGTTDLALRFTQCIAGQLILHCWTTYLSAVSFTITKIAELTDHAGPIYALGKSAESGHFLTGSSDRFVAEWSFEKQSQTQFAVSVGKGVYALHLIQSTGQLLIGNADGGIHVIDLEKKAEQRFFDLHKKGCFGFCEIPSIGSVLSIGGDGMLTQWDTESLDWIRSIPLTSSKLRSITSSDELNRVAVGGNDGLIHILEPEMLNELHTIEAKSEIYSLAFHPLKPVLISGHKDAHLRFWNTEDWSLIREIPAHNFAIYDIAFSPDGHRCASASFDKTLKVWSAENFDSPTRIDRASHEGHRSSVNAVLWLDNNNLVSISDDKAIMIWNIE
jgi:WD40 repeat protein